MLKKQTVLLFIFLSFIITKNSFSQKKTSENQSPSECEYVRHALDDALAGTLENTDLKLILIFRLGNGENSKKPNAQRIRTVKNHIKMRKVDFNRIVLAEGEKTTGLGKVEIYAEGKLIWELFAKKNKDLGYDCLE